MVYTWFAGIRVSPRFFKTAISTVCLRVVSDHKKREFVFLKLKGAEKKEKM